MNSRSCFAAFAILGFVAWTYWPLLDTGFIWVDNIIFHNAAWLRYGDSWKERVFHNFYDWVNYFRPLTVSLWVAEARAFDAAPRPMHVVSLVLHLTNTLLVGALGLRVTPSTTVRASWFAGVAMLLYGAHAALVEPVAWISSQAEMLATLFVLLGLLLNATMQRSTPRSVLVAASFFLAACAKESAAAFPLLIVLFDWMRPAPEQGWARMRALWTRQRKTYLLVLLAGVGYLGLRYWGLGFLVQGAGTEAFLSWSRFQTASYVLVTYWRIMLWPMSGLGPMHLVDTRQFATFSGGQLGADLAACAVPLCGIYLACKGKPLGVLILAITAALLPVMHLIPVDFDMSLYHERYAMTAIAVACALIPSVLNSFPVGHRRARPWLTLGAIVMLAWIGIGVANIRITLPLWTDEVRLWVWILRSYPSFAPARSHLLVAYSESGDKTHAREVADLLLRQNPECADCMLNVASLAVADNDVARLKTALENVQKSLRPPFNQRLMQAYMLAVGQLHELQGEAQDAIYAYQDAIRIEPLDPVARMNLALVQARYGAVAEARANMEMALTLFAPDQREQQRQEFERILAASNTKAGDTPTAHP